MHDGQRGLTVFYKIFERVAVESMYPRFHFYSTRRASVSAAVASTRSFLAEVIASLKIWWTIGKTELELDRGKISIRKRDVFPGEKYKNAKAFVARIVFSEKYQI